MQILRDLIDLKLPKRGHMSLINGINFGCQYEGYYDHPIEFFQAISMQFFMDQRMNRERRTEFLQTVSTIKMDEMLMTYLMNVSSKSDVSPNGVLKLL